MWDFDDGSSTFHGTNQVCRAFTSAGTYGVGLRVNDERDAGNWAFVTIHVFAPATLRVALTPTNTLLLAWPAAATGYALQQNPDLTPGNWTTVTNTSDLVGAEYQVLLPPAAAQGFYRLRQ